MANLIEGLLDVNQAAERCGYHPQTLRNKALHGEIPCVRRGVKYFFKPEDINKLVAPYDGTKSDI